MEQVEGSEEHELPALEEIARALFQLENYDTAKVNTVVTPEISPGDNNPSAEMNEINDVTDAFCSFSPVMEGDSEDFMMEI